MKFSFLTYQFCRYPLEKCFEFAKRYGFEGLEVWGARPHAYAYDMDANSLRQILHWKKSYGIEISMFTPEILSYPYSLTSHSPKEYSDTIDYIIKSLETAAGMETQYMQIACPHPGYGIDIAPVYARVVEALQTICPYAQKLGVTMLVEALSPSEGNLFTTAYDLAKLIKKVDSPFLKSMLDVVPPTIANEPLAEYFNLLKDNMAYIHICNSDGQTEFHSQLDTGVIPLTDMFQIFQNYHYNGWCSVELLAPYFKDPELYLAQSARLIQNICHQLSIQR